MFQFGKNNKCLFISVRQYLHEDIMTIMPKPICIFLNITVLVVKGRKRNFHGLTILFLRGLLVINVRKTFCVLHILVELIEYLARKLNDS